MSWLFRADLRRISEADGGGIINRRGPLRLAALATSPASRRMARVYKLRAFARGGGKLRLLLSLLCVLLFSFPAFAAAPVIEIREVFLCEGSAAETAPNLDAAKCEPVAFDRINPQGREVWIAATVGIPEDADLASGPVALFIGALASSEVWWNGKRLGANGAPAASRDAEIPGKLDAIFYLTPDAMKRGANALAIRMSSFHNPVPVRRPAHYAYIAPYEAGLLMLVRFYAPALLASGALLLAAIYFGASFFASVSGNRRDIGLLFIALMAAFPVAQLVAESWRAFAPIPYPAQVPRLIFIALCAAGFSLAMTAYVFRRFAGPRWGRAFLAVAAITAPAAIFAPGFDIKALAALLVPSLAALAVSARASLARAPGAPATAAALVLFLALMAIETFAFLDRAFYLAVAALALVLFIDQLAALRRARLAAEEARTRAAALELELVKRRIAPHFLMNALNALAGWIEHDPKTGVKMIDALAGEFRLLSQVSGRALVSLADEIALCRRHLEVMSYRTDRAFSLTLDGVDESLAVPPGVIHTLVENAFTHGCVAGGAVFTLAARNDGRAMRLELTAPPAEGNGAPRGEGGEGLSYVRRRLEAAFGAGARVDSGPAPGGGWVTVLSWKK